jgi:hypothetical protein
MEAFLATDNWLDDECGCSDLILAVGVGMRTLPKIHETFGRPCEVLRPPMVSVARRVERACDLPAQYGEQTFCKLEITGVACGVKGKPQIIRQAARKLDDCHPGMMKDED